MPGNQAQSDTFPRLLLANAERLRGRPAVREKDLGIWQTWTWDEVAVEARTLACGTGRPRLQARRYARDHRRQPAATLLGNGRPRRRSAACRCRSIRMRVAAEMIYVFEDAEAQFAIVEDQEQVDKLLEILPRLPASQAYRLR